jgi:ribosomal protein S1
MAVKNKFQAFLDERPELKQKLKPPKIGDLVEGEVVEKMKNGILVEIPGFIFGFVPKEELEGEMPKVGEKLCLVLKKFFPKRGMALFSAKEAKERLFWEDLAKRMSAQEKLKLKPVDFNRGGLLFEISGMSAFLPWYYLSKEHLPSFEDLNSEKLQDILKGLMDKELEVKIVKINQAQKSIILSEK